MPLLQRKRVLLAKIETTYGTDAAPTGTANSILVREMTLTPIEVNYVGRDVVRPYLGTSEQIPVETMARLEFEVEIAGAGAAGSVPKYGPLLRACGLAETVNAGVSVVYAPVSAAFESVTIWFNVDGVLHKLLGARGSVSFQLNAKQLPVMRFAFTGILGAITDTALPTADYTAFIKPVAVNTANTTALSIQGFATAVLETLSIDMNNQVVHRQLVGNESVIITDRRVAGALSIEATTVAARDWWTNVKDAVTAAFSVTHGPALNRVVIAGPKMQITNPRYRDSDGITHLDLETLYVPNTTAGNDELTVTVL